MSGQSPTVIEMRGIVTRFGAQTVHDGIDLGVQRGEVLGLVGGSGSGKTTLLREMIGLQTPSAGEVHAFGEPVFSGHPTRQIQALRQRWGVLFQHGALFTALSVADNVALPLRELRVLDNALIQELVRLKLAMVGLKPEDGRRYPAELSGGMIKRVGLARALALDAELLLLDEPTSGLDPVASELFVDLIAELRSTLGLTVALVTHDLDTLVDLCDRIAVLADRKLIVVGTLDEVIACDHPFIQSYFRGHRGGRLLSKRQ